MAPRARSGRPGRALPARIQLGVGRSPAPAPALLLAADILRTAVEPTWEELGRLAAIAAIRTGLNVFLDREIAEDECHLERQTDAHQGAG